LAKTGDNLTLPNGTSFLITRSAADTGGELIEMEITLPPGAPSPPRHFHPEQQEQWAVLSGTLSVYVDKGWRTLGEGQSVTIPAGTPHTLRNRSDQTVRVRDSHRPALDFEDYIERLWQLGREGGLEGPRAITRFAALWESQRCQVAARPLERAGIRVLARAGRLLGHRP
jgi:quercetin dioxygenase-like cupin family protein